MVRRAKGSGEDLDGYVTEVDYPTRLIPQLTPGWIVAVAAWHGAAPPDLRGPFRMLDIGCGSGIALAMTAACHPEATFQGIDGMASHIAAGRAFAQGIENLDLLHVTFDQALADARPDCDLITMHGVLTWAGPAARDDAMVLAARRLAAGGLLVVSYNSFPGAARQLAFQHLVRRFSSDCDTPPGERYEIAFDRVQALADAGFGAISQTVIDRLADLSGDAPPEYFVHEYLHDGWAPLWPAWVKGKFDAMGLRYLGQADFVRQIPDFALTPRQRLVVEQADPDERDLLTDMALDTPFRIDVYVREPAPDTTDDPKDGIWLGAEAVAHDRLDVHLPSGSAEFDETIAHRILETLEDEPRPYREIYADVGGSVGAFNRSICALLAGDLLIPLSPPRSLSEAAKELNDALAERALSGDELPISALTGRAGPVEARPVEIAAMSLSTEALLVRADADPQFRERFIHRGADMANPVERRRIAAGLDRLRDRFRRLGVG